MAPIDELKGCRSDRRNFYCYVDQSEWVLMFRDKVIAITGAASGIGRELAIEFAKEGACLALSDIDFEGVQETQLLLPKGTTARVYVVDVSKAESVLKHAEEVIRDFGAAHMIVNNAGALLAGMVANTAIDEYRWQLDINMYGVLYGTKAFLPTFLKQREGWIVNVSSYFGLFSYPGQSAYCMSKFAVRGLTEALWSELEGTGVNAVCVHPGGIKTGIDRATRLVKMAGEQERVIAAKLVKSQTGSANQCAREIVTGLKRGRKRIVTGTASAVLPLLIRIFPDSYPKLMKLVT
jgi:NAD(P)-dependent dehydrogenase (short-subunit alcohol dehydrogenase family)